MRSRKIVFAILALGALLAAVPAGARAASGDAKLLATFCAPKDIHGAACSNARGYRFGSVCDVKLGEDRYRGKFLAGRALLVVRYDSGCEAHATDDGGSVVFEESGGRFVFRGYQVGYPVNDCVVIPRDATLDRLVCLTGHMGQGLLESTVAEMDFAGEPGKGVKMDYTFLMTAEDSTGAYGANTVTCKAMSKRFSLDKLRAGPRPNTVAVDVGYADHDIVRTACGPGFPRPAELFGELAPGDAYVPEGHEKHGRFVIDLMTRKAGPEPEPGKAAPR